MKKVVKILEVWHYNEMGPDFQQRNRLRDLRGKCFVYQKYSFNKK